MLLGLAKYHYIGNKHCSNLNIKTTNWCDDLIGIIFRLAELKTGWAEYVTSRRAGKLFVGSDSFGPCRPLAKNIVDRLTCNIVNGY